MSKAYAAARSLAAAIVEACTSTPSGAPGGHLYAALMSRGCTLSQYERIMSALTGAGVLVKRGECYRVTGAGLSFLQSTKVQR